MPYKDAAARKAYAAKHYKENTEGYAERRQDYKRSLRAFVDDLKRGPCVDCGNSYHPCQMQFDHIGTDKVASVADLVRSKGKPAVIAEIAKCELVCANCHAARTHARKESCNLETCGLPAMYFITDGSETKYYCSKQCLWIND